MSNRRTVKTFATLVSAAALTLAGCSSGGGAAGGPSSAPASAAGTSLALAAATLSDPFQVVMNDAIKKVAGDHQVQVLPMTNAGADAAQQVTDIQNLLVRKPSGLIVNPVDADAVSPAIEKAAAAGVPVVTVDRAPSTNKVYMVVRADNYGMGELACEALGKALDGAGTVLNLQGALSSSAGLDRSNGFTDCMKGKFPNMKVINQPTEWNVEKVSTGAQTVVSTQKVGGIFLASDSLMTPPIEATLKGLNKWHTRNETGHIAIATVDGTPAALGMIRDGYFDTVVSQPVNDYAKYAVQYILAAVGGKPAPAVGPTDHDSKIELLGGVKNDLLPAVSVTTANVDNPDLWGNAK